MRPIIDSIDSEEIKSLVKWIRRPEVINVIGDTMLIPLEEATKKPLHCHMWKASVDPNEPPYSQWSWAKLSKFLETNKGHETWGLLLDGLVAIDADDEKTMTYLEERIPELSTCVMETTSRGKHYIFRRPSWADEEGYFDGAGQNRHHEDAEVRALKIDFKTICSGFNTRGVLVIGPSKGKEWIRPIWSTELTELPRGLAEIAVSRPNSLGFDEVAPGHKIVKKKICRVAKTDWYRENGEMDEKILSLLQLLSRDRWDAYREWMQIATSLKNAYGDLYFPAFDELSKESANYDPEASVILWRSVAPVGFQGNKRTMGSLIYDAKQDSPEEYEEWRLKWAVPPKSSGIGSPENRSSPNLTTRCGGAGCEADNLTAELVHTTSLINYEDLRILLRCFPEFEKLDNCSFNATSDTIQFDTEGGLSGKINKMSKDVFSSAGVYIGNLTPDVALDHPLSCLHSNIAPEANFNCNVKNSRETVLASPEHKIRIGLVRQPNGVFDVAYVDIETKKQVSVTNKQKLATVSNLLAIATDKQLKDAIGESSMMLFSLNFVTNISNINHHHYEKTASQGLSDDALITAVIAVHPELHERVCFSPETKTANCGGLYYCDPATNVWQQRHNVVMEEMLVSMFKDLPDLTASDKRHIESRRGRADMVHMLAAKAVDERFRDRLDANPDMFALSNGCVTTEGVSYPKFKDLVPEDYVSITTGWEYSREQAVAARPELEDFLAKVLPMTEERRVVLAYFASLLSGRRVAKKILVMTDRRSGNNGKSSLIALIGSFFGGYTELSKGTKFVCKGSYERDRDSHDAGLEPFRGKRLVVAEELKSNMTLDVALLKRVAGGAGVQVGGRVFGAKESFQFLWQSGIVLIFNEGDLPNYDQSDLAFRERLLFAPMRSKFVKGLSPTNQEEWTYEADLGVCARFPEWRSALADVLMEHYGVEGGFEKPPQSMTVWRDDVTAEANPAAQWCEDNFKVTCDLSDFVLLGDQDNYIPDFKKLAKAFYAGVPGTLYVNKTIVKIQGMNVSKRHVLKGVIRKVVDGDFV